jgi:hypothetical protein
MINKHLFLILISLILLVYGCAQSTSFQQAPVDSKETVKKEMIKTEENSKEDHAPNQLPSRVNEFLSLVDEVSSIRYSYKGPETKDFFYDFFVKGNLIKYNPIPDYKAIDIDDDAYDSVYINTLNKTAEAYCDSRKCRIKGKKRDLDYESAYIKTPLDWLNVGNAEKIGEELIEKRAAWKLSTDNGTLWVDTFFGVPLQARFDGNEYKFMKMAFNDVDDTEVMPAKKADLTEALQKYDCMDDEECVKFNSCSEECVNKVWEEDNAYSGPACGMPWQYNCKCAESRCQIGEKN